VDRRSEGPVAIKLTCGYVMILHALLALQGTGRIASVGSDTEGVTGSNPVAPTK
jgi:hypothetical protein